ncbi:MAG: aspartate-semialdehyde dehydrogenase [Anaerolineales bacterium]|nr:aspartate-semialdehyde dehydrogenase [Anaerolineales bacterium]
MPKLPVSILGATGIVGQRFVQGLHDHPWFEIKALVASHSSAGKTYREACSWKIDAPMPAEIGDLVLGSLEQKLPGRLVFSALPSGAAREIEAKLAAQDHVVCTNASAFRLEPDVPLIIPEVNAAHLSLIAKQRESRGWPGYIVASPNCTTTAIALPLKPLAEAFGLRKVVAVSMQAISGAGYPGLSMMDVMGNVLPFISGEEEKMEVETKILLGSVEAGERRPSTVEISAHANRVPVLDGHMVCLSIEFEEEGSIERVSGVMRAFEAASPYYELPSAPDSPLVLHDHSDRPQPGLDRYANEGMSVVVGRVRPCPSLHIRMVSLVHNTIRGAAGGAIMNAELLYGEGLLL